jgi:hypothetical protein
MKYRHRLTIPALFVAGIFSWTSGAAQPPSGTVAAAIRTASGNYLTAVNGGGLGGPDSGPNAVALHTDAIVAAKLETFTVVWLDSAYTKFALQTIRGNYVTAVNGGGVGGANDSSAPIHTDATTIAEWERLRLNFLPDARVTINVPNGRFLTAVNGGGMSSSSISPIVTTDAVRPRAWETFTLVRLDSISGDSLKPAPSPQPEWGSKLTRAEQAVITQHFGKHPPYHVGVSRSRGFPEVLRVEQYIDDAGYRPLGIVVDGAWIEPGVYGILWSPVEATRRVLIARGWTGLDHGRRKALALQWVEDSLPSGWSSQTSAEEGGHAPELSVEDGDVIVRVWLIRRGTSVAGPRISRDISPSVFRFQPDGSVTEADSTQRTPPLVR